MKKLMIVKLMVLGLFLAACSSGGGGSGGDGKNGGQGDNNPTAEGCTPQAVLADNTTGGCRIRLVSPATCQLVDVSAGKTFEIAWTTDGTGCETPWKIAVAGNPATEQNSFEVSISTNGGTITQKGGVIVIDAQAFEGLTSDNGTFHWVVKSFHGSHPASINFKVKK